MDKKEDLFKAPRWNTYQSVDVLKTKVKSTKEDKKKIEEFRKFIDEKTKNEEGTKRKD